VDPLLRTPKRPLSNVIFQESSENLTEPFSLKDLGIFDGPLRPFSNVIFQKIQKIGDEPFSLKALGIFHGPSPSDPKGRFQTLSFKKSEKSATNLFH
jgi:hypothetical protein